MGYKGDKSYMMSEMNKLTPGLLHVWDPKDNDVPYVVELGSLTDDEEIQVYATSPGIGSVIGLARSNGIDIHKLHEAGYFALDSSDNDMVLASLPLGSDLDAAYDIFKTCLAKIFTAASQEYRIMLV